MVVQKEEVVVEMVMTIKMEMIEVKVEVEEEEAMATDRIEIEIVMAEVVATVAVVVVTTLKAMEEDKDVVKIEAMVEEVVVVAELDGTKVITISQTSSRNLTSLQTMVDPHMVAVLAILRIDFLLQILLSMIQAINPNPDTMILRLNLDLDLSFILPISLMRPMNKISCPS